MRCLQVQATLPSTQELGLHTFPVGNDSLYHGNALLVFFLFCSSTLPVLLHSI